MINVLKDGREWRIGTAADVAWITEATRTGRTFEAAIPEGFAAYTVIDLPTEAELQPAHDRALIEVLSRHSPQASWWLGYLDTGADDIVFPDVPRVVLYSGWDYVLVEAGPQQAATWRRDDGGSFWSGHLPNLIFPADRSWLVSTLWDDDYTCVGGPAGLIADFRRSRMA